MTVAVVGASGFVGAAVVKALADRGVESRPIVAPRLPPVGPEEAADAVARSTAALRDLASKLKGCRAVVNAAGDPDASSCDLPALIAANAALPLLVHQATERAGVPRLVHVSSAVVQGRAALLDETPHTQPFSAYSESKALAEGLLLVAPEGRVVIYRPPSVHGADRRITRTLVAVARSPLASVAAPGNAPTPQAHIDNVGDAVAFLAVCSQQPPAIVMHPWEGFTTAGLLQLLGRREPRLVPRRPAITATSLLHHIGTKVGPVAANARRLEMIWHGQGQAESWLERTGWTPPAGDDAWAQTAVDAGQTRTSRTRTLAWRH